MYTRKHVAPKFYPHFKNFEHSSVIENFSIATTTIHTHTLFTLTLNRSQTQAHHTHTHTTHMHDTQTTSTQTSHTYDICTIHTSYHKGRSYIGVDIV